MSDRTNARGADQVVSALSEAGVELVFSLSGNQIMPIYDAMLGSSIRIVHTRHEGAAVYMAEAYAQVTGRPGVALLTAGPGFANGLSAAWSALASETPVLILSGDAPRNRDGHGAFQEMDQLAFSRTATKASARSMSAGSLKSDVAAALRLAMQGRRGPVHLALPDDVLREACDEADGASSFAEAFKDETTGVKADDLARIKEALSGARRPIALAGPMFRRAHSKPLVDAFSAASGIPAFAQESPRGLRDPRLGAFAEVLAEADLLITFGKPLDFMVGFGEAPAIPATCRIVQIDSDAARLAADCQRLPARKIVSCHACPLSAMEALVAARFSGAEIEDGWSDAVVSAARHRPAGWKDAARLPGRIHPVAVGDAVGAVLERNRDAILVIDGGEFGQWSQACLDAPASIINGPSGAIGGGIAYAIAAKAARPHAPVIAMMGDGTAGFYLAEFETALRNDLPFVAIIGNDAKWNAEHQIQVRDYGTNRTHSCELSPTRFDDVVRAMGGFGVHVTAPEELAPALEAALASGKAACINVEIEGLPAPVVRRGD